MLLKRLLALDDSVYFLEDLPIKEKLFLSMGAYQTAGEQDTFAHALDCANYCRKESPDCTIGTAIWKSTAIRSRTTGTETADITNRRKRL